MNRYDLGYYQCVKDLVELFVSMPELEVYDVYDWLLDREDEYLKKFSNVKKKEPL